MKIPLCYFFGAYESDSVDCVGAFATFMVLIGVCVFSVIIVIPSTLLLLQTCIFCGVALNVWIDHNVRKLKKKFFQKRTKLDESENESASINVEGKEAETSSSFYLVKKYSILCCFFELRALMFLLKFSFITVFFLGSLASFFTDSNGIEMTLLITGTLYIISPILALCEDCLCIDEPFPCFRMVFSSQTVSLGLGYVVFLTCTFVNIYFFYDEQTSSTMKIIRLIAVIILLDSPFKLCINTLFHSCFFRLYNTSRSRLLEPDEYFRDISSVVLTIFFLPFQIVALFLYLPEDIGGKDILYADMGLYLTLSIFVLSGFVVGTGATMKSFSLLFNFFSRRNGMMRQVRCRIFSDTLIIIGEAVSIFSLCVIIIVVTLARGGEPKNNHQFQDSIIIGFFLILAMSFFFILISMLCISKAFSVSLFSCVGSFFILKNDNQTIAEIIEEEKKALIREKSEDSLSPVEKKDIVESDYSCYDAYIFFPVCVKDNHQIFSFLWVAFRLVFGETIGSILVATIVMSFTVVFLEIFLPVLIIKFIFISPILLPIFVFVIFVYGVPWCFLNFRNLSCEPISSLIVLNVSPICILHSCCIWCMMVIIGNIGWCCFSMVAIFLVFNPLILMVVSCLVLMFGLTTFFLLDREGRILAEFSSRRRH